MSKKRTICSIYFDRLEATRNYSFSPDGPFHTKFSIDGCKRGEHKTLEIVDMFEREYRGSGMYGTSPVYADTSGIKGVPPNGGIAHDLLQDWSENRLGGSVAKIGVFICAGDKPTKAELDAAEASQTRFCDYIITKADDDWVSGRKHLVGEFQRKCAEWLGDTNHPWFVGNKGQMMATCPFCGMQKVGDVPVCQNCKHVTDPEKYALLMEIQEKVKAKLAEFKATLTEEQLKSPDVADLKHSDLAEAVGLKTVPQFVPPPFNPPIKRQAINAR